MTALGVDHVETGERLALAEREGGEPALVVVHHPAAFGPWELEADIGDDAGEGRIMSVERNRERLPHGAAAAVGADHPCRGQCLTALGSLHLDHDLVRVLRQRRHGNAAPNLDPMRLGMVEQQFLGDVLRQNEAEPPARPEILPLDRLHPRPDMDLEKGIGANGAGALNEAFRQAACIEQLEHAWQDRSCPRLHRLVPAFENQHLRACERQFAGNRQSRWSATHDDHVRVHASSPTETKLVFDPITIGHYAIDLVKSLSSV